MSWQSASLPIDFSAAAEYPCLFSKLIRDVR
jgi:hypothetical protein